MEATVILNNRRWFFEDVHPQFTIALLATSKGKNKSPTVVLRGPFSNRDSFSAGVCKDGASFVCEEALNWNDSASFPLLATSDSVGVFVQLRKMPRLDLDESGQWRARPHRELDATNDKPLMDVDSEACPDGFWPVYKGASFDLWKPDTGEYYAWADPDVVTPVLQKKRLRGNRSTNSVFNECGADWCADPTTLPCYSPRIAFRDITQRTNQRTVIAALIPPGVFATHKAPYLVFPRGDRRDEAFLLGVLASIPLDWYARRFVEVNLTFFVFNPFPVPRLDTDSPLWQRVVELAGRLACPDGRFAEWAEEVGVECGPLEDDEKQDMIHELDAVVTHLYGLTEDHLTHIFETFHVGWDYNARLDETLKHYKKWEGKA